MKLTLEPRKTTWVSFVDSTAQLRVSWRCRAEYSAYNARDAHTWRARTRYSISGLNCNHALPSSQMVIMEQGIPLAITQTVVSAVRERFQSEEMDDPFLVITDKLAGLKKSDPRENRLGKGLLERSWTETIERAIKIENKTGKSVSLSFCVVDNPADDLEFVSADPAAHQGQPPEYFFALSLPVDAELTLKVTLRHTRKESIRVPSEQVKVVTRSPARRQAQSNMNEAFQAIDEEIQQQEAPDEDDDDEPKG